MMSYDTTLQPVLRWAGSKKRSIQSIIPTFRPDFKRYIELFAGSACIFFYLKPDSAILVDNNARLMAFYKTLSLYPDDVYDIFVNIPRTSADYYNVREKIYDVYDEKIAAGQFLYLNRNCFNGIYRTNRLGKFNVPFSESRVAPYPMRENVVTAAKALSAATLISDDFEVAIREWVQAGDLVYLDPPYYVTTSRVFREYSARPFSAVDLERLSLLLEVIDGRGAQFVMSYPESDLITPLQKRWNVKRIQVRRTVAGKVSSRVSQVELLISNCAMS